MGPFLSSFFSLFFLFFTTQLCIHRTDTGVQRLGVLTDLILIAGSDAPISAG